MKSKFISFLLLVTLAAGLIPTAAAVNLDEVICLPVIMYHSVKPNNCGKDSITPWEFENDLKYLKENGYETITMLQLINYCGGNGNLPEKPVILSFDDGYYNNYKYVYPLLQKYDMCIVFSIITRAVEKFSLKPSDNVNYSHATWDQINEMLGSGLVEIQNHSYDLHKYGSNRVGCGQIKGELLEKYEEVLCDDINKSQTLIKEMTGTTPTTFAYPYGKYNDNTVEILKNQGFQATLSCEYGLNLINKSGETDLFNLKRICRAHNQSIQKVLAEAMKTLKYR